ncbi:MULTISPECIES: twin-arginine translocase TatA/TatE family subunit [unclassified Sphingomonas]|uniref:twin-arginine translocase TatA/TatE family subunit n=1 Tax=unclassified Sphingomonas TaxID=196159 RepID=UPI002151A348|nr:MULTISPECIES: twin-arginine translocase TatA/TatE family subunit [unclassified Sphingomonas]MCR5871738.1 twin-arginine translocase TatA/TatE family subunit [Sphingomonas sp. J344]UUX99974.1 twin-arginine translocase TatA/TatE family subunit [Sphingomonas sp. J315]
MGSMSLMHWLIVGVLVILLFGGSRFSNMMGDVAKGIKQFKKGMADDDEAAAKPAEIEAKRVVDPQPQTQTDARPAQEER